MSATPVDEITRAVAVAGSGDVNAATPAQFIRAFSSILVRLGEEKPLQYTSVALKLRPDLAPQITVAALRVRRPDDKQIANSCSWVESIIRNAIAAVPAAKAGIIRAALEFDPSSRECILSAAGAESGTEYAFFRSPRIDAGNVDFAAIGTINPANLSAQGNTVSENQDRQTVCHSGTTLVLPRSAAEAHLRTHAGDYAGACRP